LKYAYLNAQGGHAGLPGIGIIRRWTAQADGIIQVTGTLRHTEEIGDGVRGYMVSSRAGILGAPQNVKNSAKAMNVNRLPVRKGDTLDFIVDGFKVPGADQFNWAPVVTMTVVNDEKQLPPGSSTTWASQQMFSGPRKTVEARPLAAWEKFAQVLLLTNELTFFN